MSCRPPPRWWRSLLLAANALLPIPTLVLLFTGATGAGWLLAVTLGAHGLLLWAIMAPRSNWLASAASRFRATAKEVWLTIDDGPVGAPTRELSSELRRRGVAATFFLIGARLRADPGAVRALREDGHSLGNHTATHPRKSFWCSRSTTVRKEVDGGARVLAEEGSDTPWFRPPVGHKPPGLRAILQERGLRLIGWTTGGRDGWAEDPSPTVQRVLAAARPGCIILLHEGRAYSIRTILAVVDALLARGFRFTIPSPAAVDAAHASAVPAGQCSAPGR